MFEAFLIFLFAISLFAKLSWCSIVGAIAMSLIAYLIRNKLLYNYTEHFSTKLKINLKFFVYCFFLLREMVVSTCKVCRMVLFIRSEKIFPLIESLSTKSFKENVYLALFGNSITLTPSTITVDINQDHVILHSLALDGTQGVKALGMQIKKIQK